MVKDLDGNGYIDCWSGISVVNTGHCNQKVVQAVQEQADKLVHVCNYVYHHVPIACAHACMHACHRDTRDTNVFKACSYRSLHEYLPDI